MYIYHYRETEDLHKIDHNINEIESQSQINISGYTLQNKDDTYKFTSLVNIVHLVLYDEHNVNLGFCGQQPPQFVEARGSNVNRVALNQFLAGVCHSDL